MLSFDSERSKRRRKHDERSGGSVAAANGDEAFYSSIRFPSPLFPNHLSPHSITLPDNLNNMKVRAISTPQRKNAGKVRTPVLVGTF